MEKITQKISNHPTFSDVLRTLEVAGINFNFDAKSLDIYYRIIFYKGSESVSHLFTSQVPVWHVDNTQHIIVRDDNFQPILNPEFQEEKDENSIVINETERYLTMQAFDYVTMLMLDKNIPLKTIISAYINEQDQDGMFNF